MKPSFLAITLVTTLCVYGQLWGQKIESLEPQSYDAIKYNLTDVFGGRYSISFEKAIGEYFSFGSEVDIIIKDVFLESEHPWYPSQNAIKRGVILEPYIRSYSSNHSGLYIAFNGFFGFATYKLEQPGNSLGEPGWSSSGGSIQLGLQKIISVA